MLVKCWAGVAEGCSTSNQQCMNVLCFVGCFYLGYLFGVFYLFRLFCNSEKKCGQNGTNEGMQRQDWLNCWFNVEPVSLFSAYLLYLFIVGYISL